MPHMRLHGGGCCGMRHVYSFETHHEADRNASLRSLDEHIRTLANEPDQGNRLIEVVLAGTQVTQVMLDAMSERGFRLVSRFNNSNSLNDCYVFHHVPRPLPIDDLPHNLVWNGEAGPAPRAGVVPAAPPEPRVVFTTYHNHVRGARSEAGWPTFEAARAAAPRAMRVDKRSVYASGVTRWAENVHE